MNDAIKGALDSANRNKLAKEEREKDREDEYRRDLRPGLLRQRRNLMATCVALLALKITGGTFTKLPILGGELSGIDSNRLVFCVGIICLYFLYRCYIYTRNESGFAQSIEPWRTSFKMRVDELLPVLTQRKTGISIDKIATEEPVVTKLSTENGESQTTLLVGTKLIILTKRFIPLVWYQIKIKDSSGTLETQGHLKDGKQKINITLVHFWKQLILSAFEIIFIKREFSDYLFPFLLFGLTVMEYATGFLSAIINWFV